MMLYGEFGGMEKRMTQPADSPISRLLWGLENSDPKMSQAALARSLGIQPQNITYWIRVDKIPVEYLKPIARLTGMKSNWLIEGEPDGLPHKLREMLFSPNKRG
jgi:hypothetical protein